MSETKREYEIGYGKQRSWPDWFRPPTSFAKHSAGAEVVDLQDELGQGPSVPGRIVRN